MLDELLGVVLKAALVDEVDKDACNTALASLNEFLFQEFLGEQCAFQITRGRTRPEGIAFFMPAGRRYAGTTSLMYAASLTAEVNENRTVYVRKNRWGRIGEFKNLAAIEWLPGHPGYTFTTRLV